MKTKEDLAKRGRPVASPRNERSVPVRLRRRLQGSTQVIARVDQGGPVCPIAATISKTMPSPLIFANSTSNTSPRCSSCSVTRREVGRRSKGRNGHRNRPRQERPRSHFPPRSPKDLSQDDAAELADLGPNFDWNIYMAGIGAPSGSGSTSRARIRKRYG